MSSSQNVSTTNSVVNMTSVIEEFRRNWPVEEWKRLGFFQEDVILQINIHWLTFKPPDDSSFYTVAVLYLVILFFGFIGNFLVTLLFIRCRSLRTPANYLITNLAISDFFMTFKSCIVAYNNFYKGPVLGDIACQIYGFFGGLTGVVSIITLTLIAFDRYVVIRFPLSSRLSDVRVKISLAISWIYAVIFSGIPALDVGFGKYTYEGYLTSCGFDYLTDNNRTKLFIIIFFSAAWVIPFFVITFSYGNIIKVVATRNVMQNKGRDSFRHVKDEKKKRQEITVARVALCTILLWFISWTPYAIVALLGVAGQKQLISPIVSMVPSVFCKTAACLNAYVYALSHPKFKVELKKLCWKENAGKSSIVWTTECTQLRSIRNKEPLKHQASINSEDVVEITVGTITKPDQKSCLSRADSSCSQKSNMASKVFESVCFQPSFSNRNSGIRNMARRWSSKDRQKQEADND